MFSRSYVSSEDAPARQKIVIAALHLFVRHGLCETTIRDIAAKSGFTNPALFKHFTGKEDLALYLFERCYLELFGLITNAIGSGDSFAAKHRAVIEAYMQALAQDENAVLYVQENLRQFWPKMPTRVRKHSILGEVKGLLEIGRSEGLVATDADIALLTTAWAGALQQFARARYFREFKQEPIKLTGAVEALLRRMLAP